MTLYDAFVGFMAGEGIGRDALSGRAWHGIDHDRILIAATTNAARDRFAIATGDDGLTGTRHDEIVLGGPGRDTLTGRGGRDHIAGGTDADVLRGEAGGDFLFGGAGDDVLDGGRGADRLDGGAGADRFVFAATADSTPRAGAADRITDFSAPQGDLIDLSAIDADTGRRGDQPFRLIGDRPFSGAAGELRAVQRGDDTRLTGDTDGDGRADLLILLSGAPVLSAADVLL
jgi:Ca2+-binding RTX toxin-like protein